MLGLLNLARREDQERDKYFEQYFTMMNASIVKLDETLKEILEYSRNARNEIEFGSIDLKKIFNDILEELKYIDGLDKIYTTISVQGMETFYSDEYRIVTILTNLISNAIKYRDDTKPRCTLHVSAIVQSKVVLINVEDNGIGIQKDLLPKIFNMFFRATLKSEGAGLGLYIVRETVNKLMGTISVESEFGNGTRFTLEIPNNIVHLRNKQSIGSNSG
jgi:signal transduction histidine kinase